jgi:hypothetical protein
MTEFDMLLVLATFLLAGLVKGVIGLGLPTVSLAILTIVFDLPTAMVLLLLPSFVTNLWQALAGGQGWPLLQRLWPFLLAASLSVWIGAIALARVELTLLAALLGLLLTNLRWQQPGWPEIHTGAPAGVLGRPIEWFRQWSADWNDRFVRGAWCALPERAGPAA